MINMAKFFITILATMLILNFVQLSHGRNIHKRETEQTAPKADDKSTCLNGTPCGWAVYTPFTRTVEYFMKNTCNCPTNKTCIRTDDDLSTSAYVYRCREMKTADSS